MSIDDFKVNVKKDKCKCCGGAGVQRNHNTGLMQECPCCHGSGCGKKERAKTIHYEIFGQKVL